MSGHVSIQRELGIRPDMQPVDATTIAAQSSMTKALILCQTLSGLEDKVFYGPKGIVAGQAQWSRIMGPAGQHHFPQDKLNQFMDVCGNEAPLLWLLHSRGYDLNSLRKRETETERKLREEREKNETLARENALLRSLMAGRAA